MLWHLYVLQCHDKSLYCGISTDVARRLGVHNAGKGAKYTRGRLPVRLVFRLEFTDKSAALRAEHAFKKLSRVKKLAYMEAHKID